METQLEVEELMVTKSLLVSITHRISQIVVPSTLCQTVNISNFTALIRCPKHTKIVHKNFVFAAKMSDLTVNALFMESAKK